MTNLIARLYEIAKKTPSGQALEIFPTHEKWTYEEVIKEINTYRRGLQKLGLKRGSKILVLLRPGSELFFIMLALFGEGLVPFIVDPRLKRRHWFKSLKQAHLDLIISERSLLKFKFLFPQFWKVRSFCSAEKCFLSSSIKSLKVQDDSNLPLPEIDLESVALMSLTSGTTGKPKIIQRSFGVLMAQQNMACKYLPTVTHDKHLPGYVVSVLQSFMEGAENCFVLEKNISTYIEVLRSQSVTRLSGPPGFIHKIAILAEKNNLVFKKLESVLVGGAPISHAFVKLCKTVFPNAKLVIIYGATEAEPISFVDADRARWDLGGYPVGALIPEIRLEKKMIEIENCPNAFEIGISGSHVAHDSIHWTGDLAFEVDHQIYLIGRFNDLLSYNEKKYSSGLWEAELENLECVKRICLISENNKLRVFYEPSLKHGQLDKVLGEYLKAKWPGSIELTPLDKIPVDPRHEWKIQRAELRKL